MYYKKCYSSAASKYYVNQRRITMWIFNRILIRTPYARISLPTVNNQYTSQFRQAPKIVLKNKLFI